MTKMVSYLFFVMIMFEGCKDISEYNTRMTSFFKCVPASATNRTSCHTTDGDVNRDLYFVSIVAIIDILFFFLFIKNNNQDDANALKCNETIKKQADACIYTNKNIDYCQFIFL